MSKMFEDLKDTLKQEIRTLSKKEMSKESLDTLYKLAESLKAVQTIEAMEKSEGESRDGYSQERGYSQYMPMGGYAMNMSNNQGGSYNGSYRGGSYNEGSYNRGSYDGGSYEGNSGYNNSNDGGSYKGRRGRDGDGDGRYSENSNRSYGNYSRHTAKERMIQKLEMMMEEASTEKEREAIRRCMEQLDS